MPAKNAHLNCNCPPFRDIPSFLADLIDFFEATKNIHH